MDARQADLLKQSDPTDVGRRLRAVRVAKGMTQADVSGDGMSVAYVSRMESGQRRPTARALVGLAHRLAVPVEQLLGAMAPREVDEIRMTLDYAELSLESGEPQEAATRANQALERLDASSTDGLNERGRLLHARALEALGETDDAIIELESLVGDGVAGLTRIKAGIALSRAYRESGDFSRAIETGERILTQVEAAGLDSCDEAVQLAVTVAAAHFERGDAGHAVRTCRAAITKAEVLGSSRARA
ncbi:MAG: helix-turn-helix domain-containing protein, partial [Nocardioides sp.]|nr:helix-turn-helix domain-containing protein [Nocardioides sp.]